MAGLTLLSCGGSTIGGGGGGQSGAGGSQGSGGSAVGGTGGTGGTSVSAVCNGVACAPSEECCLTTGECFDPAKDSAACVPPKGPGPQGQAPCAASSQCAPGEYCAPANQKLCLGPGYCRSKTDCPSSSPGSFCGCNGVTYPDLQAACAAGVAVIGAGACGQTVTVGGGEKVTYCATNANCPTGEQCCGITGQCYDPAIPALCTAPPPGTTFPCVNDTQCHGIEYCFADTCDGPGGCMSIPSTCSGEFDPVCGCNGKTYVNTQCAAADGTRVAHKGQCP